MIKFILKWKIGKKWMMHDENKGMWCSMWLCAEHMTYEENWTLSVMENMASSNEGSLTIVG